MPIALTTPEPAPPLIPPRKRWTRDECVMLVSSEVWEQQRLELIDGELISKMGQNRPHAIVLTLIMHWLIDTFGRDRVNVNAPIDVAPGDNPINEPEPDLIVLTKPFTAIRTGNPQPGEVALVVEVSDSSLRFDLSIKALLYARAGIPEYWVADVAGRRLIVHREPTGYASIAAYSETEAVAPIAAPTHQFSFIQAQPGSSE